MEKWITIVLSSLLLLVWLYVAAKLITAAILEMIRRNNKGGSSER